MMMMIITYVQLHTQSYRGADYDSDINCGQFGDRGKLCLVRFVNSSVTVRVGGGWKTLEEFFDSNDPCRRKHCHMPAVYHTYRTQ